jgi:hypothetical protein
LIHLNQTHSLDYPILACIAQDILALPGVSISVEQLFQATNTPFWTPAFDICLKDSGFDSERGVEERFWSQHELP